VLQKKGFGDDRAGAARSHGSDRRDDQMSHQDDPFPHAVNDDRGRQRSQVCDSVADCGRIAIRHGQGRKKEREESANPRTTKKDCEDHASEAVTAALRAAREVV